MNKKIYIIAAIIIVIVVAGFAFFQSKNYHTEISEFSLTSSSGDSAGIASNSRFILTSTAPLTPQVIEKYITINPPVELSVNQVSGQANTYEIIPEEGLDTNRVYTLQIEKGPIASRDFSWAYQVKAPFNLTQSLPGNKAVDFPVNSGIELEFNRENISDPQRYIEITPPVSGTFRVEKNKVIFIPKSPLKEASVYTLTIKKELTAQGSTDTLASDIVLQFETTQPYLGSSGKPSVYVQRQFMEFNTGITPAWDLSVTNASEINATVYRFSTADEYYQYVTAASNDGNSWARYVDKKNQLPENKQFLSVTLPVQKVNYQSYVTFNEALPAGYYAVVFKTTNNSAVGWFQVSPTASFAMFAPEKTLLWLKDIPSTKNVAQVPILLNGKEIARTGPDGVALFTTPESLVQKSTVYDYNSTSKREFFVAKVPSGDLIIPIETEYGSPARLYKTDDSWNYVSLNKNVYLPTDTVRFWAIEKMRKGSIEGEEITVQIANSSWTSDAETVVYAETKIKISDHNTLTGELAYKNLKPGYYSLLFKKGTETIDSVGVYISAYIQPAYKISLTSNKNTIFAGDTVTFTAKAQFFDGTPVANTSLNIEAYGEGVSVMSTSQTINLNSQGEGTFTLPTQYRENEYSYWPGVITVRANPIMSEEGQIETSESIFVFGPHVDNKIERKQEGLITTFNVTTREIVLPQGPIGQPFWGTESYLGNPVGGITTTVDIAEVVYKVTDTGRTWYDPINKIVHPIMEYKTEYPAVSSQAIISNQSGFAQFSFNFEKFKRYRVTFSTRDSFGRIVKDVQYVYPTFRNANYVDYEDQYDSYVLQDQNESKEYGIGDSVHLRLSKNTTGVAAMNGEQKFIFLSVSNGNIEYRIQDTADYISSFREQDIPNVTVWAGWFEKGRFKNSYSRNVSFRADDRRLTVKIVKDKATYKPGETVNLGVYITDKNNRPVKAEVNLSALDEAVFSLRPYEEDVVNNLYQDNYPYVVIRTSNVPPATGGGAEKGGGDGDGNPRSNLQEVAIFKSITTDSNGFANVQFKLPDNITSWRIVSQAVTKDLFAGKNVSFIPVTLPLFVDLTLNKTYLAGDKLDLRLRAFGTGYNGGAVNYSVLSSTLPFKSLSAQGMGSANVSLGTLPEGTHQITVKATSNGLSDSLTRPINVLKSYFTRDSSELLEAAPGMKIEAKTPGYTTLYFSSLGKGQLYDKLRRLGCQCGLRIDQRGTAMVAQNLLETYFGKKEKESEVDLLKYQETGLRLFPYSSEDLEVSALGAHLFSPDEINRNGLKSYLTRSLNDEKSDVSRIAQALYGLSSFDNLVLSKLQQLKNEKALNYKDKIYLALGLEAVGAKEDARSYYRQNLKPLTEEKGSYAYASMSNRDDTITTTALLAVLAAELDEPEAEKFAAYVNSNRPKSTLINFELLLYAKAMLPKLSSEPVEFAYTVNGKEEKKKLEDGEGFELTLSPEALKSFTFSEVKGKLGVVVSYEESISPSSIDQDTNLSLTRSYSVNGVPTKEFKEGDVVKVTLNPRFSSNALDGSYEVTDYVPSGLRPVASFGNDYYYGYKDPNSPTYPLEIHDQKITFIVWDYARPITYYARVVSKGTYKAEPAILQSLTSPDSVALSHEETVTVK